VEAQWGPGAKPWSGVSGMKVPLQLINLGNLDYIASVRGVYASTRVWAESHFHILLQQASADCHCMLAGESMISSNMTNLHSTEHKKLRFNVPQTYLCLNRPIRNKIGLPPAIG